MMNRYFYSARQKGEEFLGKKIKGTKIFMFHQVSDDVDTWKDPAVCITRKHFLEFVETIENRNYKFISLDELAKEEANNQDIIITFDDVFQDAYENAFPILKEKRIPFCVFISECFINTPGYLSKEEIEILKKEPLCTIGYHSKNHQLMRSLSKEQIFAETNPKDFESQFDLKTKYFAFPYGSRYACTYESIKLAVEHGYQYIFSTIAIPCGKKLIEKRSSFLPRINVNNENYKKLLERFCK